MKNNLKRVFSLVLAIMLCITFIPMTTASAKTFKDVPTSHWAYTYINEMSNQGYISGYPNGTFKPRKNITFLEAMRFAAILTQYDDQALAAARQVWQSKVVALGVPKWAQDNVVKCLAKGVVDMKTLEAAKKNKMFTTDKAVSRVNLAEYFAKAMGVKSTDPVIALPFKDVKDIPEHLRAHVAGLIDAGVISPQGAGKGYFYPRQAVKREQVARMVYAALQYQAKNTNPVNPVNPVNPINPVTPVNPTPTVVTGTIKEISVTGITAIMLVNDNTANGKVFSVDASTVITVDGSIGNISSLLVGQNVTVTANSALGVMQAKSINAKGVEFSLEGEVTNVDNSNKEIKISYTDNNKNKVSRVFKVDSNSSITINNKARSLYDVKNGSQVKATIRNDVVKTLDVTASSDDYKGYIKKLTSRDITIVSLNGRENTYRIPSRDTDYEIYDSRYNSGKYSRDRKLSYSELERLGSVYVEIETDARYNNEVSYIEVRDGFDNEYIVYSNNSRGRYRDQWQIELYPKDSTNSYRDRETYYYDYDLRADNFDSRSGVRVRDIGEGSRVVILEKDKDVIKKIMVIDSRYNNGYSYNDNYIYGKVTRKGGTYLEVSDNYSSKDYIIDSSISLTGITEGYSYYFKVSDKNGRPKLITWSEKEPSDFRNNSRYGYDKSITIKYIWSKNSSNSIDLTDSNGNDYYIDRKTDVSGYYRDFYELRDADSRYVEGLKADITLSSSGYISKIYIYK